MLGLFFSARESSQLRVKTATLKPGSSRIQRLLGLAQPHWWKLITITVATFLTSAMTLAYPALTGKIIDSALASNLTALRAMIFFLIGLALVQAVISFWQEFGTTTIGEQIVIDLRIQLYSHLQNLPLSFFQDNRTGELLSRLTNDVSLIRDAVTIDLISLIQNLITLLLGIVVVILGPDTILSKANTFINLPVSHATAGFWADAPAHRVGAHTNLNPACVHRWIFAKIDAERVGDVERGHCSFGRDD